MNLSTGLPRIINERVSFSCFWGVVKGSIEFSVYDNGSQVFPSIATIETNLGSGSVNLDLSGNETIKKSAAGVDVTVEITNWSVSSSELSFHVKASGKKGILGCTVFNQTLRGARHNSADLEDKMNAMFAKLEQTPA